MYSVIQTVGLGTEVSDERGSTVTTVEPHLSGPHTSEIFNFPDLFGNQVIFNILTYIAQKITKFM